MKRRKQLAPALIVVSLLCGCIWCYGDFQATCRLREASAGDLAECRRLARDIQDLEAMPTFAALEAESPGATADRIEQAVQLAMLPAEALVRVQPQSDYRLGDSSYRLWPTRLELQAVTMPQLTGFLHHLGSADQGLTVRDVRVWVPAGSEQAAPERWSAEITLTQLAFSPTNR